MDEQFLTIQLQVDNDDYELVIGEKVGRVTDPLLQVKVLTPTEEPQTAVPDEGYEGLISVSVLAIPSDYVGSGIARRDGDSLAVSGPVVTVPAGYYASQQQASVHTEQLQQPTIAVNKMTGVVTVSMHQPAGYVYDSYQSAEQVLDIQSARTVTPTESVQTAVEQHRWTIGEVKVDAIPSDYVGSAIPRRDGQSITVANNVVTVPNGYYANQQTKSIHEIELTAPTVSIDANTGLVTVVEDASSLEGYLFPTIKSNTLQLPTQVGKIITPIEAEQTAVAAHYWTLGAVKVAAIPSDYVGSGVAQITLAAPTVAIDNSTGLITATEVMGSGYLTGATKTGTKQLTTRAGATITPSTSEQTAVAAYRWTTGAVKVAAIPSQYIVPSGTLTITEEGTFDVTHYASALINMGVIPITKGGTGATTAAGALSNLGAVAKAGDTMTGNLTLQKKLILTSGTAASYGSTLPSSGSTGEVFFKLS